MDGRTDGRTDRQTASRVEVGCRCRVRCLGAISMTAARVLLVAVVPLLRLRAAAQITEVWTVRETGELRCRLSIYFLQSQPVRLISYHLLAAAPLLLCTQRMIAFAASSAHIQI